MGPRRTSEPKQISIDKFLQNPLLASAYWIVDKMLILKGPYQEELAQSGRSDRSFCSSSGSMAERCSQAPSHDSTYNTAVVTPPGCSLGSRSSLRSHGSLARLSLLGRSAESLGEESSFADDGDDIDYRDDGEDGEDASPWGWHVELQGEVGRDGGNWWDDGSGAS